LKTSACRRSTAHESPSAARGAIEELAAAFGYSLGLGALPVNAWSHAVIGAIRKRGGRNPAQH